MRVMNSEWIEPYDADTAPTGLTYALYDTKVCGEEKQGSYWYSLPDGYEDDPTTTHPVFIWLHGGMSRATQGAVAVKMYKDAVKAGKMPKPLSSCLKHFLLGGTSTQSTTSTRSRM